MNIGELARRSGLTASRIRFYETKGLLCLGNRKANGYRDYPPEAVQALELIACAQQVGFSLDEIASLMSVATAGGGHDSLLDALRRKLDGLDALQQRLAQTRAQLLRVIQLVEDKPAGMDCLENAERVLREIRGGAPRAA